MFPIKATEEYILLYARVCVIQCMVVAQAVVDEVHLQRQRIYGGKDILPANPFGHLIAQRLGALSNLTRTFGDCGFRVCCTL